MGGPGSGGWNRLSDAQHRLRGTYRRDRHGRASWVPPEVWAGRAAMAEELESRGMRVLERAVTPARLNRRLFGQAMGLLGAADKIWTGLIR